MHDLYKLKEMLCEELKEYGKKGELSAGSLEVVDTLAHAAKNLDKIIEAYEEEEGYSERGGSYARGGGGRGGNQGGGQSNRGGSYENRYSREYYSRDGGSYARGRGRNARRDSMGRYSSEGGYSRAADEMVEQLEELKEQAPDNQTRQEIQRLITKFEQM